MVSKGSPGRMTATDNWRGSCPSPVHVTSVSENQSPYNFLVTPCPLSPPLLLWHCLLMFSTLLTLPQAHSPSGYSLEIPAMFLPQGLCTGCPFCLVCSSRTYIPVCIVHCLLLQVFAQMSLFLTEAFLTTVFNAIPWIPQPLYLLYFFFPKIL